MFTVLDFAGLTNEQVEAGSVILGGEAKHIIRLYDVPIKNEAEKIDWPDVGSVVVRWGDERVTEWLEFLDRYRRFGQDCLYRLVAVMSDSLREFHVIYKHGRFYSEELEDFEKRDLFPDDLTAPFHAVRPVALPWEDEAEASTKLRVIETEGLAAKFYCELPDHVLTLGISIPEDQPTDGSMRLRLPPA